METEFRLSMANPGYVFGAMLPDITPSTRLEHLRTAENLNQMTSAQTIII